MELSLQEINDKLEKISGEYSKLSDQEQKLNNEKQKLLAKDICDNKYLSRYKWKVRERYRSCFTLKPILDDIMTKFHLFSIYKHTYIISYFSLYLDFA